MHEFQGCLQHSRIIDEDNDATYFLCPLVTLQISSWIQVYGCGLLKQMQSLSKKNKFKEFAKENCKKFLSSITHKSNQEIILNCAPDARAQQNIFVLVFYSVQTLLYSKSNQCLPLPIHVTSKVLLESHCVQFQRFLFGKADIAFRSHYIHHHHRPDNQIGLFV